MKNNKQTKWFVRCSLLIALSVGAITATSLRVYATSDLVGHWAFDETIAGTNAADTSGNNNDGIPSNDPVPSTDIPAAVTFNDPRSVSFDGSQYFTINRPVQDSFSICAWIKTTSVGNGPDHWDSAPIMDSEVGGLANDFGFGIGSDGALSFGNGGDGDITVHGSIMVNDGDWHNVCATRDQSTGLDSLYVDAVLDSSGITSTATLSDNPNARIGWGYDGGALFVGNIDDLRVYDVSLSQSQVSNLNGGSDNPNIVPDNDNVDKVTEDAAPNSGDANNDGTLDSEQANVTSMPDPTSGNYVTLQSSCDSNFNPQVGGESSEDRDNAYTYPAGLLGFVALCGTNGATATFTVYFYGNYDPANFVLREWNPANHTYTTIPGAVLSKVTIGGQPALKAVYQIIDGSSFDRDGTPNGNIVDPVGIGLAIAGPNTGLGQPKQNHSIIFLSFSSAFAIIAGMVMLRRDKINT